MNSARQPRKEWLQRLRRLAPAPKPIGRGRDRPQAITVSKASSVASSAASRCRSAQPAQDQVISLIPRCPARIRSRFNPVSRVSRPWSSNPCSDSARAQPFFHASHPAQPCALIHLHRAQLRDDGRSDCRTAARASPARRARRPARSQPHDRHASIPASILQLSWRAARTGRFPQARTVLTLLRPCAAQAPFWLSPLASRAPVIPVAEVAVSAHRTSLAPVPPL